MRITDFLGVFQKGGARPTLFEVRMPFPVYAGGVASSYNFSFVCQAASIPGQDITPIITHYMGREVKVAGDRTFQEWTIQVINDEDFVIRDAFEQWNNAINAHVENIRDPQAALLRGYQCDVDVIQYAKTGEILKTWTLVGAWPSQVQQVELSWETTNTLELLNITFQYQYWVSDTTY